MSRFKRKARVVAADSLLAVLHVLLAAVVNEADDALARLKERVSRTGSDDE